MEQLAREEGRALQEENQGLREEIQNLRNEKKELFERVQNLKVCVAEKENVNTGIKNELKRLQRRIVEAEAREQLADAEKLIADEEIHALRERVSELEATYLGGYRD